MNFVLATFVIFSFVQAISAQTTKPPVKGDPCTVDDDCSKDNNDLLCNERTMKCDDADGFLTKSCINDGECKANEICLILVNKCVLKIIPGIYKRCKTDAECNNGMQCVFVDETGFICKRIFESCEGKCTGTNQVCFNGSGKAICACKYPYSGTPPNCNLNCSTDYDCRSDDHRCRKGQCIDACIGECTTSGLTCFTSNHRGHCNGRG